MNIEVLMGQIHECQNIIQKLNKQADDKDEIMQNAISANETVIDDLKLTHTKELNKLKTGFERQQEFVYAMQELKIRTSEIRESCNACDIETQTQIGTK
jgi:hypothetical protein